MALAKLVCGDCGATISPADAFCPSCGARIDREAGVVADRVCKECGSRNAPRSEFCASCGAAFAEAVSSRGASPRPEKPPVRRGEERRNDKRSPVSHRFEPWQYIAAAAVPPTGAHPIPSGGRRPPSRMPVSSVCTCSYLPVPGGRTHRPGSVHDKRRATWDKARRSTIGPARPRAHPSDCSSQGGTR